MKQDICKLCARWEEFHRIYGQNRSPGVGPKPAELFFVGEAYGEEEAIQQQPFVGRSGKMLTDMLTYCGVRREDVFITNAVKCWAEENKTPTLPEIKRCRPFLLQEINKVRPKLIIAIGRTALTSLGITMPMAAAVGKFHESIYTSVPVYAIYHPAYIMRNPKLKDENYNFLKRGLYPQQTVKQEEKNYVVVQSVQQAEEYSAFLMKQSTLAFDIETQGLDFLNEDQPIKIKCVGFSYAAGTGILFPEKYLEPYVRNILESDVKKIAHNIKFDAGFLRAVYKIEVKNIFMDTMLAAYQMDENTPNDLEFCVNRYLPELQGYAKHIDEKYRGRTDKANGPDLWNKNFGDIDATYRLAKMFFTQLKNEDMWWLHENILIPSTKNFIRMEEYGVQCDRPLIKILETKYNTRRRELQEEIKRIPEVEKFERSAGKSYNPGSPVHNQQIFIDMYKLPTLKESKLTGKPSIGATELLIYAEKHNNKLAKLVREVKLIDKAISTYLTGFVKYLYKGDIAHTQFNLNVTTTGRTSSGGSKVKSDDFEDMQLVVVDLGSRRTPNLQNINKKNKELRNIVRARDGCYLLGADYSQVELAVAAAISRDEVMMKAYMSGRDLHTQIASEIFDIPYDNITKELRQYAKACLGENSYVFTNEGLTRPTYLKNELLLTKNNTAQSWNMITDPVEETLTLEFTNGIKEEYRPDHKLLTWNGSSTEWKAVRDITKEDEIISVFGQLKGIEKPDYFIDFSPYYKEDRIKSSSSINIASKEWCYIFGLFLGDGSINFSISPFTKQHKSGTLTIIVKDEEVKAQVISTLVKSNFHYNILQERTAKKGFNYCTIAVHSLGLCEVMTLLFPKKDISDEFITNIGFSGFMELLAGLLDSDGTLSMNLKCLKITNEAMVRKVALISMGLGIPTRLRKYKAGITTSTERRYHYKNNKNTQYKECYELAFHEIDTTIPVRTQHKVGKVRKLFTGFSLTEEMGTSIYKQILKEEGYSKTSPAITKWNNIKKGHATVTPRTPKLELLPDIQPNYYMIKMVAKTKTNSKIYVIQTEYGHYLSGGGISHNCSFGITYGMSAKSLAKQINKEEAEAQEYIDNYFKKFHRLKAMLDGCRTSVDYKNYVVSPFGRRRRFTEVSNKAYRQAGNFGVQATASDLLLLALNFIFKRIDHKELYGNIVPVLAVHDESNIEVRQGYIREGRNILVKAMTEDIYRIPRVAKLLNPLKLRIDVQISTYGGGWGTYSTISDYPEEVLERLDTGELIIGPDKTLTKP